ncbi:TPA: hypothetical protein U1Z87_002124 [Streptococcus suis]|nr:hypothetical protein [Streptococcus suis]
MTNEKLGVLLVDVPELMYFDYNYIMDVEEDGKIKFTVNETDILEEVVKVAWKCTQTAVGEEIIDDQQCCIGR